MNKFKMFKGKNGDENMSESPYTLLFYDLNNLLYLIINEVSVFKFKLYTLL